MTDVSMFWYNVILIDYGKTTEELEVRLKIGQILFDAGARPVMNQDVYTDWIEQTNNHQYKNDVCKEKTKRILQELEAMCYKCQSLAEIARTHVYDQMRLVRAL